MILAVVARVSKVLSKGKNDASAVLQITCGDLVGYGLMSKGKGKIGSGRGVVWQIEWGWLDRTYRTPHTTTPPLLLPLVF
jgi:hypothetical protein